MIDLTKARLLKGGEIITPKGRLMWPALFKPSLAKGETDPAKAQYQANLLLPKNADLKVMIDAINAVIADKWGADARKKYKIRMPFKKTEEDPKLSEVSDAFPVSLRAWTKERPEVVYADAKTKAQEEDVYAGRWACLMMRPFTYDHATGGKGVSLGLQHVQLLDHDEPLAGAKLKPEDGFEAVVSDGDAVSADALFEGM